jgi:4-hydroxythreonine-4-phosphate dehydrogenase
VRLAVTLGDPRGVGPEVARAAAASLPGHDAPDLIFVGPTGTVADHARDWPFHSIGDWTDNSGDVRLAGALAGRAIEAATALALDGEVDGIVTAPIDKAALHAAGYDFPGHTEMLASLTGADDVVMMMASERTTLGQPLRVVLATTHIALQDVPARFTTEVLVTQTLLTAAALRDEWGIARPRVALCAFNPHASDGGLFGNQEVTIYGPALVALRAAQVDVTGPVPADTVFVRAGRGEFDVVISPYHDVGMAAFKTAAFGNGVNVTLGLPFVRTSPDHGTAIDIAGTNRADPSSMIEAIHLAVHLVKRRRTSQPS